MAESLARRLVRHAWFVVPKRAYSDAVGWAAALPVQPGARSTVLGLFAHAYGIDLREVELPIADYPSIDAFFTRRLKPGSRPIDATPGSVVSPADGRVVAVGPVTRAGRIQAKNVDFDVATLLAAPEFAERFHGGSYATIYLSPRDYHRVHTPAEGTVQGWRHVPGTLYPVNKASSEREPALFARNERVVTFLEGDPGFFAVVMVAAIGVGHITLSYDPEAATHAHGVGDAAVRVKTYQDGGGPRLGKGEELGIFHLGSTAIILFERDRVILDPEQTGQVARMGACIGTVSG